MSPPAATMADAPAKGGAGKLRAFAWSALEGGGLSVISFLALVAFSRLLAPGQFGLFATALSLFELFTLLSTRAFQDALVQIPDLEDRHHDTAFTLTLLVSAALSAGFWAAGPAFRAAMHDPLAGGILGWLGLGFVFNAVSATLTAQQRREFAFRRLALRSLAGRVAGAGLGIAAALAGWGVWSLVVQQLASAALASAVLWFGCSEHPRLGVDRAAARQLVHFAIGAAGAEFVNSGTKRLFTVACGMVLGAGPAGYINLAFRLVDTLWGVASTAIYQVVLPIMSRLQHDGPALRTAFDRAQRGTCALLYPAFLLMALEAEPLVHLLFGPKWLPAAPGVTMLALTMLSQVPRMLTVPILTAIGRPRDILAGYAVGLVYVLSAVTAAHLPGPGAALAIWAGGEVVLAPVFAWALWRRTGIGPATQLRNCGTSLAAGAMLMLAALAVRWALPAGLPVLVVLVAGCMAGAAAYAVTFAALDPSVLASARALLARKADPAPAPETLDPLDDGLADLAPLAVIQPEPAPAPRIPEPQD